MLFIYSMSRVFLPPRNNHMYISYAATRHTISVSNLFYGLRLFIGIVLIPYFLHVQRYCFFSICANSPLFPQGNRIKIVYYSGDADALRGPCKSVDVAGCSPRPRAVWQQTKWICCACGDDASRVVIGFVELQIRFIMSFC